MSKRLTKNDKRKVHRRMSDGWSRATAESSIHRNRHVRVLRRSGMRAEAFDLLFPEPSAHDAPLIAAMKRESRSMARAWERSVDLVLWGDPSKPQLSPPEDGWWKS